MGTILLHIIIEILCFQIHVISTKQQQNMIKRFIFYHLNTLCFQIF